MKRTRLLFAGLWSFFGLIFLWSGAALANVEQVKLYKKAFGEKPKCACCHVDKLPKKDDGKHDLNEYGEKVKAAKTGEMPDEATYQKVGKNANAELAE